jgi:hypothetical protein
MLLNIFGELKLKQLPVIAVVACIAYNITNITFFTPIRSVSSFRKIDG